MFSPLVSLKRLARLAFATCTVVMLSSLAFGQTSPPVVLARSTTGAEVTTADVLAEIAQFAPTARQTFLAKPEAVEQVVNNLLVRRALAKEGERDGLAESQIMAAALQIARDRVISDARLAKLDAQNSPSDAAMESYARNLYQANLAKFEQPAQTRARHILLANSGPESLNKAKELVAKIRAGAPFEEMAKAHSTDTGSASRGGDLGFFGAGKMVRPFEEAVDALKTPGQISEPVESQFGYHIIKLEERRPKGHKPFDEVKAQLATEARTALLNESRMQKVESLHKGFTYDNAAYESFTKSAIAK